MANNCNVVTRLTECFNLWLSVQRVPNYLKTARMVVLSKSDTNFPNYGDIRPIVILPTIYKVFESIILARIKSLYGNSIAPSVPKRFLEMQIHAN